jgi:hypothetical protein
LAFSAKDASYNFSMFRNLYRAMGLGATMLVGGCCGCTLSPQPIGGIDGPSLVAFTLSGALLGALLWKWYMRPFEKSR